VAQLNHRIAARSPNLLEMLATAGVGQFNAPMSVPYMYWLPSTCDPAAQGVIQIVEGLQNLLNARGARLEVDGWMGAPTVRALMPYAGADWRDKTWMQLYGDVLRGRRAAGFEPVRAIATDGYTAETGLGDLASTILTNPLAWIAGGAAAYYVLGRKRQNPRRRA
jgi:hypothetical protein